MVSEADFVNTLGLTRVMATDAKTLRFYHALLTWLVME